MENQKPKSIKLTLKAIRVNMGKTLEEMAEEYRKNGVDGITKDIIHNWETYKTFPTVKDIPNIELVTGLKYDDIIFLPSDVD